MRVEKGFFDVRESIDDKGKLSSAEASYFVFDAENESEALECVRDEVSPTLGALFLKEISIEERINDSTWKVRATYERNESKSREASTNRPEEGSGDTTEYGNEEPSVSFDTTGGTKHVTKSIRTVASYPNDAPSFGGAIGVDSEGNIGGVDAVMPTMSFTETHYFPHNKMTDTFKRSLMDLTGSVNDKAFRGFNAGEVLFMGVSAKRTGTDKEDLWELTFSFNVSKNESNIPVAEEIVVATKRGWDYLWIRFVEVVENGKVTKKPSSAYVEQIYKDADFSQLGINFKEVAE